MGYVAQLVKGNKILKLDGTAGLKIGLDFVPPSTQFENIVGSGTSMNQYGGGTKFSDRAVNTSWTFSVRSMGSSNAICERQLDSLGYFLQQAGDVDEPLYFEFRPDSTFGFEPLWGQHGANRRVEIVAVDSRGLWDIYGLGQIRERVIYADIGLQIKPFAYGKQQRLASAVGGVFEDTIGVIDGRSRGLVIPLATTNKVTNPVFGNPADWDHDWTTGASIASYQNTQKKYLLFGTSSARLFRTASADYTFRMTLTANAVTHCLSFYVRKADASAVTSADCQAYYDAGALVTAFEAIEGGWYRAWATLVGTAAADAVGVIVNAVGVEIYVDGFQLEATSYPTPLCYGDLLGCAWTGAVHDSTSSRTAGRVRVDMSEAFDAAQGTISVAWRTAWDSNVPAGACTLFSNSATGLVGSYFGGDDKFYLTDNTNTASSSAVTFVRNDVYILHFVWGGGGGLKIYINGSPNGSNATYTPGTLGANLYIGTDDAGANPCEGIIIQMTTYNRPMSATEVLADYNNIYPVVAANYRADWIPWLWTKDGDDVCDYYCDATHDSQAIVNGVPGDVDAKTVFQILSTRSGGSGGCEVLLSQGVYDSYVKQSDSFHDLSGTADGAALGGEYITTAIVAGTPLVAGGASPMHIETNLDYYLGQNNRVLFATRDHAASAAENLKADLLYDYGGLQFYDGKYKTIAADNAGIKTFYIGPARFIDTPQRAYPWVIDAHITVYVLLDRLSGTQDNHMDWFELLTGRFVHIKENVLRLADSSAILEGQKCYEVDSSGVLSNHLQVVGDIIELTPKKYNMLTVWSGSIGYNQVLTNTSTFSRVYVTPRWITA